MDLRDTSIAGIALARRATLATRNIRHFDDLVVPVANPLGVNLMCKTSALPIQIQRHQLSK